VIRFLLSRMKSTGLEVEEPQKAKIILNIPLRMVLILKILRRARVLVVEESTQD
jgi:hypothetical protein